MSFSSLSVAELTALRDALYLAALGSCDAIKKYSVPGLNVEKITTKEALDSLREVDEALTDAASPMGDFINVHFDSPE